MVAERRNGNLLVQLGPRLQAFPEELIRQRRTHDGQTEYLIRWCLVAVDDGSASASGGGASEASGGGVGSGGGGSGGGSTSGEPKPENILMWMSTEDVYANCPALLGKRAADEQQPGAAAPAPDASFDQVELSDMKEDVKNLVRRARKQMAPGGDGALHIMHTIHVLSAYASIGALVGVFKETGALNLLMELLCNRHTQTRRSAGKMLRALASHDAGSRAYVLLSLSQQDGIEQHMDFDNRFTLLELFAETTSSEEHGISFEGIHLPQIPGKLLFSLVKRYLCVTSLMDKLNTAWAEPERQDSSPAPSSSSGSAHQTELLRLQREFDFTMAMANLISELVRVMGWDRNRNGAQASGGVACGGEQSEDTYRPVLRSIFQPRFCASPVVLAASAAAATPPAASPPKKKAGNGFKTRSDFASRSAYVEYVQDSLKSGMAVRMLEDYEEVSAGDEGEFRYSNDGSPPVQVYWNSLSRTYWVHWHMVEILGSGSSSQSEKETQEKASTLTETLQLASASQTFFSKPPGGLYSLPYLSEAPAAESASLSRAEWWEVLFFIKKLEAPQQQEVNAMLRQSLEQQEAELDDAALIGLAVPADAAKKLLHYLKQTLPAACLGDLLCSHAFCKHYLRRGGASLEDEELLAESSLGGVGAPSLCSSAGSASTAMGSVSKKAKKEPPADSGGSETESELPTEDDSKYPEDLEDKMKVFNNPRVQGKKSLLEKLGEVVDVLKKGAGPDHAQQLAAVLFMTRLLEEKSGQEKNSMRGDSAMSVRDRLLKLLVELVGGACREVVAAALRLAHLLMLRFEWRVAFATEGGVKAVLSCMQEFPAAAHVQQLALATLKVITGASRHDLRGGGGGAPLSESGSQVMLEIFASIGSATPEGSSGLLGAIPAAIDLMLSTKGGGPAVRNGLLLLVLLVSSHRSLAEQLVASGAGAVLRKCLTPPTAETMLAIIALNHIAMVHKLDSAEGPEQLDLKDSELQMLVVGLKEPSVTKEVIQTLEQLLCDGAQLEEERRQVTHSRDTYQDLVRLLEQHRADRAVTLSVLRILNKFLDNYEEDELPWHESIEPCLSSMAAFVSDREVAQLFVRFLYRLASLNKDYAVVMCRLGTKEALLKAGDKHGGALLMLAELRELVADCDKYASLYKKMTTSVLAGCIQMVLGQIEEHRRSHQPINIPFFDVFLRNLCQGSSVELKEDKCWEKVEVSSNHHRANKLTDKNPKTYWESNGCTGSHFINIYMHKGVVIRQLAILVASEDSSYMPARVLVLGGDDPTNINTELNSVNVAPSASRVVLLENMTRFWSIIQIRIKRCQQGGIDTRVRGFEVLGPKPTFWPVFKEQLCCRTFLFYSTKAHSWSQEVERDRGQLPQLFSRLNSALRHEQMFADRFLPDAEAAEALGRTCWEALISPIVQSITSAEPPGVSPLSWLLSEYLEGSDPGRRCTNRAAIFRSRVRRLTHLLVHVDTSRPDAEELRPPAKSKGLNRSKEQNGKEGKNRDAAAPGGASSCASSSSSWSGRPRARSSSSIAGIALCWQGVVQQQVSSFLDSSGRLPDLVERFRLLYLRLRGSMEELFGQQTAFRLALRRGFSSALLQLSILRAMHVSERLAQYLDQLLVSGGAVSGPETLQRLQTLLEPLLFLSGLELANTFEHFYRYYLGDRLLARGPPLWLEAAVVEQIGSCFPSRFPQQMLKNLSESRELQQEFHLYRLQQLDRQLQEDQQMMEEEWAESEEDAEVQVLVLSPRCWSVSALCFLDEPAKYFPAELCSYLSQFTQFYTHSQSMVGLSPSQPRRLQWTWLGHAELSYNGRTLQVSTLQMFILLAFNSQEELSVQQLLASSGVPAAVLLQALQPLTATGGPLTCTQPDDPVQGMLQLDQQAAWGPPDGAEPPPVRLLPAQTYLTVDEDAASTLERKRSFMYCLIVHVMKQEKEMHIDNLVFRVLDSCQKQDSSRPGVAGRFSCSTGDVLSCILHVISKGCVRRGEDNPHILEFVPEDPTTPQKGHAQFCFSRTDAADGLADISLVPAVRRLDDGVLDAVLFSMGRTMSQEEVRQLMQRTVQQVSATLSLDPDWAEHLLVHCRWNVDLLVQRYTDDPDAVVMAAGLKCRNPLPAPSPASSCPVCLGLWTGTPEPELSLSCRHYCCRSCWQEYLTARIEQNLVMSCNCPITDCQAQPTSQFFLRILTDKDTVAKYQSALLRGYVECCSNLTWCTNPQGCDQILCRDHLGGMATCSSCCWSSCFSCNFPEAHYPASCSHMSQWMDDGGFYEGMTVEAQSKHLAKLISKRCPSCQAPIEKNEGCLHMTCAKCNHGFCWRCLKPWKPTHKDYYNCSAMVSKAARQEKKFQDYNERCTFQHQAKDFAVGLESKVSSINEALQMKALTFVIDACKVLAQARKVLAFSCVYSYYNQETEKMDVMEQQTEALDLHTNALQILLEETLLQCTDLASCVRLLKTEHLNTGLELIRRIQDRLMAILQHSTQDFRVGFHAKTGSDQEAVQASGQSNQADSNKVPKADRASDSGDSDNNNYAADGGDEAEDEDEEYDEEYVPEWHEDYDEDDIDEDDFFSDDDESENLGSPFD